MKIKIPPHTLERAEERGASKEEIEEVLRTGDPLPAKGGRLGKAKVFSFQATRLGRYYEQKKVEVICVVEGDTMTTVTVYVFYGSW